MRDLWHASIAALGGGLVTFAVGALVGLNSWVSARLQRSWFLPGYEIVFPVLLAFCVLVLLYWSRRAGWSSLMTVILGMTAGEVAGTASYFLHPFIGRGFTVSQYVHAFLAPDRLIAVALVSIVIPAVLLAWLYGGVMTGLSLLGYRWLRPRVVAVK